MLFLRDTKQFGVRETKTGRESLAFSFFKSKCITSYSLLNIKTHIMYFVLRIYETITPSCVFQTPNFDDATGYANIMHRTDGYKYIVVKEA